MASNYPSDQRGLYTNQNYASPQYQQQMPSQIPVYQSQPQQFQYGQPVVTPAVVTVPQVVVNQPVRCRTVSINMTCPFCKQQILTNTTESFNYKACCVCCLTCFVLFALIQCCNDKDIGCTDCEHRCPACAQLIGKYYAM